MEGDTIIGVHESHDPLRSLIQGVPEEEQTLGGEASRVFKIHSANTHGQRNAASVLISRMYLTRGYVSTALPSQPAPSRITFTATEFNETIGTITIGFDSDSGLHVDDIFADETEAIRRQGRQICEFTKLAIDSVVKSKRVLASLFHVAYIFAHRVLGCDDLVIEVNPRHVRYYERMLGFKALGPPRHNPRVNAPAVLMRLRFSHAHAEIDRLAGSQQEESLERSLYPYFFSVDDEASIAGRLVGMEAHRTEFARMKSGTAAAREPRARGGLHHH